MRQNRVAASQDRQTQYAQLLLQQVHRVDNQRLRNRVAKAEMLIAHGKLRAATNILEAICAEQA